MPPLTQWDSLQCPESNIKRQPNGPPVRCVGKAGPMAGDALSGSGPSLLLVDTDMKGCALNKLQSKSRPRHDLAKRSGCLLLLPQLPKENMEALDVYKYQQIACGENGGHRQRNEKE